MKFPDVEYIINNHIFFKDIKNYYTQYYNNNDIYNHLVYFNNYSDSLITRITEKSFVDREKTPFSINKNNFFLKYCIEAKKCKGNIIVDSSLHMAQKDNELNIDLIFTFNPKSNKSESIVSFYINNYVEKSHINNEMIHKYIETITNHSTNTLTTLNFNPFHIEVGEDNHISHSKDVDVYSQLSYLKSLSIEQIKEAALYGKISKETIDLVLITQDIDLSQYELTHKESFVDYLQSKMKNPAPENKKSRHNL